MHPNLAQGRRLVLYLLLFLPAGLLLAEIAVRLTGAPRSIALLLLLPVVVLHAFSCLASWYLCRTLPLDGTPAIRLVASHLVAGLFASGLMIGVGWQWAGLLAGSFGLEAARQSWSASLSLIFVFGCLLYTLAVAVHYLMQAQEASRAAQRQALELELLAQGAELRALKAQIDPHFLFNSLNSIASLVSGDPAQARRMCIRLAGFLRHSLEVAKHDRIVLKDELELVDLYLGIEQIRFGERLRIERRVGAGSASCLLPPLLLQPLVENAVRHGIAHLLAGGTVRVRARRRGENLRIEVENPCDEERPASRGEGIGLANVRRRLEAAFGERASFSVQERSAQEQSVREESASGEASAGSFRVVLSLPYKRALEVEERS